MLGPLSVESDEFFLFLRNLVWAIDWYLYNILLLLLTEYILFSSIIVFNKEGAIMPAELAKRLKKGREAVGLTLREAAIRLGYTNYQTLSKIESGEREVKVAELSKFAKAYYCDIQNLLGVQPAKATPHMLWRHAPEPHLKKEVERRIFYLSEQAALLQKLLEIRSKPFHFLEITLDDLRTNKDVDSLAGAASKLLNLGKRPAFTLAKVLEQEYGVSIFYCPLTGSAASMMHADLGAVMVINSNEAPWRRSFDTAHEFFHLITWKTVSPKELQNEGVFQDIESKADRFASSLLLPEQEVAAEITKRIDQSSSVSDADIVDVARNFGVSTQALIYRLAQIRLISWDEAKRAASDRDLLDLNKKIRAEDWGIPPVSERLNSLAIRCLRKGLISRGKFAELVGIDRAEIDHYMDKRGLLSTEGGLVEIMAS